jgi:glycosyltransferase involved in cell wall biosynthesis
MRRDGPRGAKVSLAVDVRLFAYPELGERGIGHYVEPHLRSTFRAGTPINVTLIVDREGDVHPLISRLSVEFGCRVASLERVRDEVFDIVHIPDPMTILPGYDSPLRSRPRSDVTTTLFYDLIPLRIADQHIDRWDQRSREVYLNRLEQVTQSDCHIFSISDCTRVDLISLAGIDPERITTIHAGCNFQAEFSDRGVDQDSIRDISSRHGIRLPFFLIVGGIEKHKNFPLALEAFVATRKCHACQLVVVGSFGDPYKQAYRDLCREQGISDVLFTGFLEKEELRALYNATTAVLVPSLYEGFGFPALEAMEQGSPVIASSAASLPEVVGDAGFLLPPDDPIAWSFTMRQLLEHPDGREVYRQKGISQARRFSWQRNGELVREVWNNLLSARQVRRFLQAHP